MFQFFDFVSESDGKHKTFATIRFKRNEKNICVFYLAWSPAFVVQSKKLNIFQEYWNINKQNNFFLARCNLKRNGKTFKRETKKLVCHSHSNYLHKIVFLKWYYSFIDEIDNKMVYVFPIYEYEHNYAYCHCFVVLHTLTYFWFTIARQLNHFKYLRIANDKLSILWFN